MKQFSVLIRKKIEKGFGVVFMLSMKNKEDSRKICKGANKGQIMSLSWELSSKGSQIVFCSVYRISC